MEITMKPTGRMVMVGDRHASVFDGHTSGGAAVRVFVQTIGYGHEVPEAERAAIRAALTGECTGQRIAGPPSERLSRPHWHALYAAAVEVSTALTHAIAAVDDAAKSEAYFDRAIDANDELAALLATIQVESAQGHASIAPGDPIDGVGGAPQTPWPPGSRMPPYNEDRVRAVLMHELATASPPYSLETFTLVVEALSLHFELQPTEQGTHICEQPSPRLPCETVRALLRHPSLQGPGPDAGRRLAFAICGLQMGWHVRHCHPSEPILAFTLAPDVEPAREAYMLGYRIAFPIDLTDALRAYHDSHLVYRAPEMLTEHEREIVLAVDAERGAP